LRHSATPLLLTHKWHSLKTCMDHGQLGLQIAVTITNLTASGSAKSRAWHAQSTDSCCQPT